jgi:hypothetical protein
MTNFKLMMINHAEAMRNSAERNSVLQCKVRRWRQMKDKFRNVNSGQFPSIARSNTQEGIVTIASNESSTRKYWQDQSQCRMITRDGLTMHRRTIIAQRLTGEYAE